MPPHTQPGSSNSPAAVAAEKQSCPPATTAAVAAAGQLQQRVNLLSLLGSSSPVLPLLCAAGLQQQLDLLLHYCQRWELAVNLVKQS
jgi:hypothetical protein